MGDAFGRKRMRLWALGLFIAGSAACAIAPSLSVLVLARALQGFGGGGLMTPPQALIGDVVSPKERRRFQGWFGANFFLASTLGPVIGDVLSQYLGWRSIFWVNVPLGLGAAAAALRVKTSAGTSIRLRRNKRLCRFDRSVTSRTEYRWSRSRWVSPAPFTLAGLGASGFVLLRAVEQKSKDPLTSPQLIGDAIIWRASLTVLLFAAVFFGLIVQLPVLFSICAPDQCDDLWTTAYSSTGHPRTAIIQLLILLTKPTRSLAVRGFLGG